MRDVCNTINNNYFFKKSPLGWTPSYQHGDLLVNAPSLSDLPSNLIPGVTPQLAGVGFGEEPDVTPIPVSSPSIST